MVREHKQFAVITGISLVVFAIGIGMYFLTQNDNWNILSIPGAMVALIAFALFLASYFAYLEDKDKGRVKLTDNEKEYQRGYDETKSIAAGIVSMPSGAPYKRIAEKLVELNHTPLILRINVGQGKHYTKGAEAFVADLNRETKKLTTVKEMKVEF